MYKVTLSKEVQEGPLKIIERSVFYFDVDSAALLFCDMATTHGFGVEGYERIQSGSVNFAVASVFQKYGVDISK